MKTFLKNLILIGVLLIAQTAAYLQAATTLTNHASVTRVGTQALITLDATRHGEWQNVNGDHTPYRYLIDVTPGAYQVTFVDNVPGYVAWSAGLGSYALPGLYIGQYDFGSDSAVTVASLPWTSYDSTPSGAFVALTPKDYTFQISSNATLVVHLHDHILTDNTGGLSFILKKTSELQASIAVNIFGRGSIRGITNGQSLTAGQTVAPKAKPGKGYVLSNWLVEVDGVTVVSTNRALPFVMQSNLVLTVTFVDVTKPQLKVLAPRKGEEVGAGAFTIKGTVKDNGTDGMVWHQLNGGTWTNAAGWTNWSSPVTLVAGLNTLLIFAQDQDGNCSKTNSLQLSIDSAATYWLPDYYYPATAGGRWIYDGADWDGSPAQLEVRIDDTSFPTLLYTGKSPVSTYTQELIKVYNAYGSYSSGNDSFDPYDEWEEFITLTNGWGIFGNDDGSESIRVDHGFIIADPLKIGQAVALKGNVYESGAAVGTATFRLQLMEVTDVTVPAGTFTGCLRIRLTLSVGGKNQSHDEWWAPGFGNVKAQGVSGAGAPEHWELIHY